jgi:YVTN family beta-propeller protein
VASEADDSVSRIDARSGSVRTIPVENGPIGIAFGEGAVWVANSAAGTVSRIDPETNEVVATIAVGNRPVGIAVGASNVWVSVQEPVT